MRVTIAENAGFCFGVQRATDAVDRLLSEEKARIAILGHLIHNRVYNEELERRGAVHLSVDEVEGFVLRCAEQGLSAVVVIRTHGIPLGEEEQLYRLSEKYPHLSLLDMTCPFVKKIHKNLKKLFIFYKLYAII